MKNVTTFRIVLVEDEPEVRDNLMIGLTALGLDIRGVGNGTELDLALAEKETDIVLLDLCLPGEDGLEIARRLRGIPKLGIIMLTARGMTEDRIVGRDSGADCYFVKPVDIFELAAAINNLGRRLLKRPATAWQFIGTAARLQTPIGVKIPLTAMECLLLELLISRLGSNVQREEIFKTLGFSEDLSSNSRIEVLISRLRSKVAKADSTVSLPLYARNNKGYIFLAEEDQ